MKLFLHIGTAKTGTTTIQKTLHQNREMLLKKGVYIPQSLGSVSHNKLALYAMRSGRSDTLLPRGTTDEQQKMAIEKQIRHDLHAEIRNIPSHVHTMVISSEHLHSRILHEDEVRKLRKLLLSCFSDITIICYLRPQIDMAVSLYTTGLRHGCMSSLQRFIEKHAERNPLYYDFDQLLNRWECAFGHNNMVVRLFSKKEFSKNDLIFDFFEAVLLDSSWIDKMAKVNPRNKSLNRIGQTLLRYYNMGGSKISSQLCGSRFSWRFIRILSLFFSGKGYTTSAEFAETFQAQYKIGNEHVRDKYFPTREKLFDTKFDITETGEK